MSKRPADESPGAGVAAKKVKQKSIRIIFSQSTQFLMIFIV
jgi:E3 ubiquitin-protein ligase BRE1